MVLMVVVMVLKVLMVLIGMLGKMGMIVLVSYCSGVVMMMAWDGAACGKEAWGLSHQE